MANSNLVNSLLKGLDILSLVGRGDGMRLGEIASALEMKPPTAHNLVRSLLARGFLEKRSGNVLHIGPALLEIAASQEGDLLSSLAERELHWLYDRMPEGVLIFGIASSHEMKQIFRMTHERPRVLQRLQGDAYHPYASSAGLVGLAFSSESSRLKMEERRPFAEFGAHLWRSRKELEDYLALIRKERVAIDPFEKDMFFRIATPVFDSSKRLIGVVGASIVAKTIPELKRRRDAIALIKESAERIGQGVGRGFHREDSETIQTGGPSK